MRKHNKPSLSSTKNDIDLSFVKQNKQLNVEQNRLNVQILRVHTIQKQRMVNELFMFEQQQLCQFFSHYSPFPYTNTINVKSLLQCTNLKLIKNSEKIYFGQVERKKRVGKGVNIGVDGKIFQGQFVANQKMGLGVQIYPNGNLYLGEFQNSKKHGQGQFFWFSLSSKNPKQDQYVQYYDGQWWGGLPDGQGIHQKINGDLYTGNFKNGLKHGQGTQRFSNGDIYKGEYVNGLPEGYGQYHWHDNSYYKGDFKQGLRNGYGVWGLAHDSDQKYKGHYAMDKKTGYGVYQWQNGWMYKGNFDHDLRNGFGELYDGKKLKYRGYWKNGQQTDEEIKNNNGIQYMNQSNEQTGFKAFSKSNSQVYNRKSGSTQNFNIRSDQYRYQHNPQDQHFDPKRKNKSATKRKDTNNWGQFASNMYEVDFMVKKRPQSFNSNKGATLTASKIYDRSKPRSTITHDTVAKAAQNRTNFTNRDSGRTIPMYHGGSKIGNTITRPLMKGSHMGNLYVPQGSNRLEGKRGSQRF